MILKIAVVSDIHCHPDRTGSGNNTTYLFSDMLRVPEKNHPIEHLSRIIEEESITVDYTVCLGDITDKMNKQGFISGWNYMLELNQKLEGKEIIATVGNHDVDSRGDISDYNFEIAKGIRLDFPFKHEHERSTYWDKGGVFIETDMCRFLVVNSAHFHNKKDNCHYGKISHDFLDYVDNYLNLKDDSKFCIAFSHHQPITHENSETGSEDKIVNGNLLLDLLCKYKFHLYLYGHQHDPLLTEYSSGCEKLPLLSAGSFSSYSNAVYTGKRNYFHVLHLEKTNDNVSCKIMTWAFIPKKGWGRTSGDAEFPPVMGFGFNGTIENLAKQISSKIQPAVIMKWADLIFEFPEIENIPPDDLKKLKSKLNDHNICIGGYFGQSDSVLYKNN